MACFHSDMFKKELCKQGLMSLCISGGPYLNRDDTAMNSADPELVTAE